MKENIKNPKPAEMNIVSQHPKVEDRQDPIEVTLTFKRNAIDEAIAEGASPERIQALKTDLATFAIMSGSV